MNGMQSKPGGSNRVATTATPLPVKLLPDMPAKVIERFPEMGEWQAGVRRHYEALRDTTRREFEEIRKAINSEAVLAAGKTGLKGPPGPPGPPGADGQSVVVPVSAAKSTALVAAKVRPVTAALDLILTDGTGFVLVDGRGDVLWDDN